ncbi:hypothetical protein GGF46_000923 [Coemansia sp. RSA 552]|nr:hypothetical protein GGF46_000923 [Coemansia sp. RSA 552]
MQKSIEPPPAPASRPNHRGTGASYSGLGLTDVPDDVPVDLRELDLSCNLLTQLPSSFGHTFATLRTLDISANRLTLLPADIGCLGALRELRAGRNAITRLPSSFERLHCLRTLDVSDNCIAALDASISHLEGLRALNVSNNRLVELPSSLGLLAGSLRALAVDGNPLGASHRTLLGPILTVPLKETKRSSINPEKARRAFARMSLKDSSAPARPSKEHVATLKRLVSSHLRRHRRRSRVAPDQSPAEPMCGDATPRRPDASATGITDREGSNSSAPSTGSPDSCASSGDELSAAVQNAAAVSRVLWRLRDEWDLDPQHRKASCGGGRAECFYGGSLHTDGALAIEHAYREKAPSAGGSQRMKILSELLVTEVTYVDTLKNVVGIYLNPMREAKVLSETELREIFSNIEVILAFHNDHFLPAITHAISQPGMAIGGVFLHHGAHFRLYSTYTNNYEMSAGTLSRVISRRAVSSFIQGARHDVTQIGQVSLDGHLLTPIQRLPRYRMLLTDLLSNTPPTHPDHEALSAALKELNETIYNVNEKKRAFENQTRLRRLQESISGSAAIPLVAPHRVLLLVANFRLEALSELVPASRAASPGTTVCKRTGPGSAYRYFLFNDMLVQCAIVMNRDMRVSRVYRLGTHTAPARMIRDNELRIVGLGAVLYLAGNPGDVQEWVHTINQRP